MVISLKIENVDRLTSGAPLSFRSQGRSFEIGREGRDWTLSDPDKIISGRHCQIRFEGGAYWLYDTSRNGTFVNGSSTRVASPYRLASGDRLRLGNYIISVSISEDERAPSSSGASSAMPRQDSSATPVTPDLMARTGDSFFGGPASRRHLSVAAHPPSSGSGSIPAPTSVDADDVFRRIAAAAGVSPDVFLTRDRREVAAEIGAILRIMVDELAALLKARAAARILAKSSERTMIGPADNNPLKFVPASEEIMEIMFTRQRSGYLDAKRSVEEAFRDLRTHELATYAAMQTALFRLLEDLSPETIEGKVPTSAFGSAKARAWDAFVAAWRAREEPHENGMLDVFLAYFSEAYAKAAKQKD